MNNLLISPNLSPNLIPVSKTLFKDEKPKSSEVSSFSQGYLMPRTVIIHVAQLAER